MLRKQVLRAIGLLAAGCLGSGCASHLPTPAVLDPHTLASAQPETTQTLNAAASELLGGRRITLGSSAFVHSSRISLEHSLRNSPRGRLATGRTPGVPEELRLQRVGRRCELVHSQSDQRVALPHVACIEEPAPDPG